MENPRRPLSDESKDKGDEELEREGLDSEGRPRDEETDRVTLPTPPPPD